MKKSSIYLAALALVMAGCSTNEPVVMPDGDQTEVASSFITIRMMNAPTASMGRADGVYENGKEEENEVSRVRFFFFDGSGDPFGVHRNTASSTYDSYIDWYPTESDITSTGTPGDGTSVIPDQTVEKVLTATLGINLSSTNKPAQVLAVINPNQSVLGLPNSLTESNVNGPSLSALQNVVADYYTGLTDDNFVMSNSVYAKEITGENGPEMKAIYTTALTDANFATSVEAAQQSPVIIYVERVLARLDLGLDPEFVKGAKPVNDDLIYKAGNIQVNDSTSSTASYTDAEIYVKLLGWNVTRTTSQSRLVKEIDPTWTDAAILGQGVLWNTADFHRSFWAINPLKATNPDFSYQYGSFGKTADVDAGNINPAQAMNFPTTSGTYETTYLQENAAPAETPGAAPESCSQVIIAAQLVDVNGNPLTLAEWGYKKYTLSGVKNQLAKVLNNLYSVETTSSGTVYTSILPEQITFQYADPLGSQSTDKNYWVYAVLTTDASNLTWQVGKGENGTPLATAQDVNSYIRDQVNHVMIWNGGLTYYYFNIRHLGANDQVSGYNGIVRNHIYRSTITSISGLGVPVYDPDQIIIPETQSPDDFIISADLRILQWRVVSQDYELKWE